MEPPNFPPSLSLSMVTFPFGVSPSTHVETNQVPSHKLVQVASSKTLARPKPRNCFDQNSYTSHYHEDYLSLLIKLDSSPSHELGVRSSFKPLRMPNQTRSHKFSYVGQTNTSYQPKQ